MKLNYKILTAGIAAALMSTAAIAGYKQPQVVDVDLVGRTAQGDMVSAQKANDDVSFIGCGIRKIDDGLGGANTTGFCQARDADEEQITCFTTNPELLAATATLADSSFIFFAWNEDNECIFVGVSTQSFYLTDKMVK